MSAYSILLVGISIFVALISCEKVLDHSLNVQLKIALKPRDIEKLHRTILEVSSPKSKSFRQYLNKEEIRSIVGRDDADIQKLLQWLNTHEKVSLDYVHPHRDWITISTSISNVEKLFSCTLGYILDATNGFEKIASVNRKYSIPESMKDIIELVSGLSSHSFPRWKAHVVTGSALAAVASVTPQTIYDTYQSPLTGSHGSRLGSQAVVEFGNLANFNEADTQTFFSTYLPQLKGETCGMAYGSNNGGVKPSVEANLDVQYIMAAGTFINTTDYKITFTGGIEEEFLEYTQLVNAQIDPPLVHSISYGEYGGSYDNATDQRFSYELEKMGLSGISVLLASGDNGVGCNSDGSSQEFDYPSSPYITMVGATYLDSATKTEVGATLSSGGFSKDFMQASWQADAVNAYFNSGVALPSEDYYQPGRAYPDVSAFGQNVLVVASGKSEAVSGTSCSAPILAGLVASINDELLKAGKQPLGFLNPWLYANPQMFTDVTSGSNPYQKCSGFQASVGWDPVTGLGTPIYPKMLEAAFIGV